MRYRHILFLLGVLLFTTSTDLNGQIIIEGQIIDQESNEPLPFVNVGVVGKNIGTVSEIDGSFKLIIPNKYNSDSLKCSMIGYQSKTMSVQKWNERLSLDPQIQLHRSITQLEVAEVSISKKAKRRTYGNKTKSTMVSAGFSTNSLGAEIGIPVKFKSNPAYEEKLSFQINRNLYDTLIFRVNFYSMSEEGLPKETILNKNILVELTGPHIGEVSVDLRDYNIICHEDVVVTLEWLRDYGIPNDTGLMFSFAIFNKGMIIRETSQGNWAKIRGAGVGLALKVVE